MHEIQYDRKLERDYVEGAGQILLSKTEAAIKYLRTVPENIIERAINYEKRDNENFKKYNPEMLSDDKEIELLKIITGRDFESETLDDYIKREEEYIAKTKLELLFGIAEDNDIWIGEMEFTIGEYIRKIANISYVFMSSKK